MKKILKILMVLLIIIILIIGSVISYVSLYLPNINAEEDLVVDSTKENIEHGKYLANTVMGCMDCHAERDHTLFVQPVIEKTRGAGGSLWSEAQGFPGKMYSPNITSYNLKDWTDGELFRAITSGVGKDGHALFPIMPYLQYGRLPKEDIYDVIAYLRTLDPIVNDHPPREMDFPLSLIVNLMPKEGIHDLAPNSDPIKYGEYIITSSACYDCHTPMKDGRYIDELAYAGGFEFQLKTGGIVRSSNITPDIDTGIGEWSKEAFIAKFRSYQDSIFTPHKIAQGQFNTEMPWAYYSNMNENELSAIYDYLMSLTPISHQVEKFTKP